MQDTNITLVGNLTDAPELRFTQAGVPVVNFTVAVTPRTFDKQSQAWIDGTTAFHKVTAWRTLAENLAALNKGERVIVTGNLEQEEYVSQEGEKRRTWRVTASSAGVELTFAKTKDNAPVARQVTMREALGIPAGAVWDGNNWHVPTQTYRR